MATHKNVWIFYRVVRDKSGLRSLDLWPGPRPGQWITIVIFLKGEFTIVRVSYPRSHLRARSLGVNFFAGVHVLQHESGRVKGVAGWTMLFWTGFYPLMIVLFLKARTISPRGWNVSLVGGVTVSTVGVTVSYNHFLNISVAVQFCIDRGHKSYVQSQHRIVIK